MLFISDLQSDFQQHEIDQESKNIFAKIFEMQWALAGKVDHKNANTLNDEAVLSRTTAIVFIFKTNYDIIKYGKYLEHLLISCMINKEKKLSDIVIEEINGKLMDIMKVLLKQLLSQRNNENEEDESNIKAMNGYLLLLIMKYILMQSYSKDIIDQMMAIMLKYKQPVTWIKVCREICHICTAKSNGSNVSSCKYLKALLLASETLFSMFYKNRFLIANPRLTILFDIIKMCITYTGPICTEVLRNLLKFVNTADEVIGSTVMKMTKENGKKELAEKFQSNKNYLKNQLQSFVSLCLEVFQSSLSKSELSNNMHCSCNQNQQIKSDEIFGYGLGLLEKAIGSLSMDIHQKELHWMSVMSYNFGILAQRKASKQMSIKFLNTTMQILYAWIENSKNDHDRMLSKMAEVNLIAKQKVLVEMLTDIEDVGAVANCLGTMIQLLFTIHNKSKNSSTHQMIESQVQLWEKSKLKLHGKSNGRNNHSEKRLLSKSIRTFSQKDLQDLMELELDTYKASRHASKWKSEIKELLHCMMKEFADSDAVYTSRSIIEYATSDCINIEIDERHMLCRKALEMLQSESNENPRSNVQALLATAHFYVGYFTLQLRPVEAMQSQSKSENTALHPVQLEGIQRFNCNEVLSSFRVAVEIWTKQVKDLMKDKSKNLSETTRSAERSVKCLKFIGIISSLLKQSFLAVTAYHLSLVINEHVCKYHDDAKIQTSYDVTRLLAELYDFTNASNVYGNAKIADHNHQIQFEIIKSKLLNKVRQCERAKMIIKDVLRDESVLLKTPFSLLIKTEALMEFACSQEFYTTNHYNNQEHPILAAQDALKILRSLFKLYFETENNKIGSHASGQSNIVDSQS
eukprot:gene3808-4335_t